MPAPWTTYVIGPVYTLFPRRWKLVDYHGPEEVLARAALISGVTEAFLSANALVLWFNNLVHTRPGGLFNWETITDSGVVTFLTHPLTWILLYFAFEGIIRTFAAAMTSEVCGTLPLHGADYVYQLARKRNARSNLPLVPDEITPGTGACDIKIASCRKRSGWKYPFTIRYAGAFFQVIADDCVGAGPRPYIYSLRRLPIGEIARGLKDYDPKDVLVPVERLERL